MAAIEIVCGTRTPYEVVGDEHHDLPLTVHLHPGLDMSQLYSFVSAFERDDLILDDVIVTHGVVFSHLEHHVGLGPVAQPPAGDHARMLRVVLLVGVGEAVQGWGNDPRSLPGRLI